MKISKWFGAALAVLALSGSVSCQREVVVSREAEGPLGEVRISLSQDERTTLVTKADPETDALPPVDSFWVEIYNSKQIRLYREKYETAKSEVIKLNAGEFRLVASHGDTLGAGFGKAYYLADTPFTVHGYADNGGQPDRVSAVAKLSNVKLAVSFGENLQKYYSNYYAVVRNEAYPKKQVKFGKDETREGYIPGGNLYLEVFAQLAGRGAQDGGVKDSLVYFKSEPAAYAPNDFVTYTVDCGEREGHLNVDIQIDNEVELVEKQVDVPTSALPKDAPFFTFHGIQGQNFDYGFSVGLGAAVADATVAFSAYSGLASATLTVSNPYLTGTLGLPATVDLINPDPAALAAYKAAGIIWHAQENGEYGFLNVSGALPALSVHSTYVAADPKVAAFTLAIKDTYDKEATAVLNLNGEPVSAVVNVIDYNIWGWKFVEPYADFSEVNNIAPDADIRLQYSLDGTSWQSVAAKSISGRRVVFNNATGLTAGREYQLRVLVGGEGDNFSQVTTIKTEDPEQVLNNGFEEYTEQSSAVKGLTGLTTVFNVTWWQLYGEGTKAWAVNSTVSIPEGGVTVAYPDYKCYPTVAVSTDAAYDGPYVQVATVAENGWASEILYGDYHVGEIFLGRANGLAGENWASTSEGASFANRPASLSFMHKFNCNNSKPYYVLVEVLDSDGNVIGQGSKNNQTSSVSSWTRVTVPVSYSVTNRKAGGIRLKFMSCQSAVDNSHRSVTVYTLSGEHKIHAGNILSLDNVEMLYQE